MFLVDANVISEATNAEPAAQVLEWLARNENPEMAGTSTQPASWSSIHSSEGSLQADPGGG